LAHLYFLKRNISLSSLEIFCAQERTRVIILRKKETEERKGKKYGNKERKKMVIHKA
jgi:hypothetical protein